MSMLLGFNCDISDIEKEQIYKNLYFFDKKLNYKNIFSYECNFHKDYMIKIITMKNLDNISINTIDYVKFLFLLLQIKKEEEEIKKLTIFFSKDTKLFSSNIIQNFTQNMVMNFDHIYRSNNFNEILMLNSHLKNEIKIFIKKLLKIDKQIEKINVYIERNNNEQINKEFENSVETNFDENFYLVKIFINRLLFHAKILFMNDSSIQKFNTEYISTETQNIQGNKNENKSVHIAEIQTKEITNVVPNIVPHVMPNLVPNYIQKPSNIYKLWTIEEENNLLMEMKNNIGIEKIAKIHERSLGGIEARIKKIIINMFVDDKNISQICDELYLTKYQIKNILDKK